MNPATSNDRPERRRLFEIGALTFDIDQAHRIVRERPRQVGRLDVTAAAVNAGFHTAGLPPGTTPAPRAKVNAEYAMKEANLNEPVLLASLADGSTRLVDGFHRLYKAWALGLLTLPAYLLTREEALEILLE